MHVTIFGSSDDAVLLARGAPQLILAGATGEAAIHAFAPRAGGRLSGFLADSAARQLAQVLGCETVRLVCNKERIAINLWRRWRIRADYDQSWQELGARRGADGFFELSPMALQELDYEQIPSKKRSEARKRAALLDAIHDGLHARLVGPKASFTLAQ